MLSTKHEKSMHMNQHIACAVLLLFLLFPATSSAATLFELQAQLQSLLTQGNAISTPAIHRYIQQYIESLPEGGPYVEPVGSFRIPRAVVKEVFQSHTPIIKKASKEFAIDQFTLGAIIIDEIARMAPFEPIYEKLQVEVVGRWVSVGVAQVSIDTANDLIGRGLYNPNPNDTKLPFPGNLANKERRYLYRYVVEPKHNIRFAAAVVRDIIDFWSTYVDLSDRPEIIGTLYHKGRGDPHSNPMPNKRGVQIADEFYAYAKQWLT